MKKILAMFVAFACTLGAFADVIQANISGTDFSTYPVGVFTPGLNDSGADDGTSFWYTGFADDLDAEVVNVSSNEETGAVVNYLAFESNVTNPLYRTVNNCYGFVEGETQNVPKQAVGDGLFIDTTVQFTPYLVNENHPAPTKTSDDDKIIVWVRETEISEGQCETNLIVTAGYILAGANVEPKDYVVQMTPAEVSALCQSQHRLTIKAFDNITSVAGVTIMGFVVYIDGNAVSYDTEVAAFEAGASDLAVLMTTPALYYNNAAHKLFPSMVTPDQGNTAGYSSITAVGFAGMGQIGEVWFDDYTTDYPAFAGDNLNFTVEVGNGVTSFEYLGNKYSETTTFAVAPGTVSIAITGVQYDTANGWSAKAGTWYTGNVKVENAGSDEGDSGTFLFADGDVFTLAGFKANFEVVIGDETFYFQTLMGNIAEEGALAASIGGTLKLLGDVTIEGEEGVITVPEGQSLQIDLNGHTIKGTSFYDATIVNFGTLVVTDTSVNKDGKVLGNGARGDGPLAIDAYNGSVTEIYEGEFDAITDNSTEVPATITLYGGKFFDWLMFTAEDAFYLADNIADGKAIIDVEERVEEEVPYYWVVVGENAPEATPVAKIGETEFTTLEAAIEAATAESTIVIVGDIATDVTFEITKTVTIDLNGCTIAMTENDKVGDGVFCVKVGGVLTINDSVGTGVINGVGGADWDMAIWADGGQVVINGGNFTNEGASSKDPNDDHFDLIYAKHGGIVEITGGTFKCQTPRWTLNSNNVEENAKGSFVVTGGKFYQYDPTNINTDDQPVTNWCPANYKATLNGDYYTVEMIPEVTVTLPVAPANTTLKAFVGEDEVAIVDNAITVLAGSSVVLELTAAEGYEFSKDVTVYTTEAAVVNENADWSSIVLPAVTAIVTDPWAPAAETDAAAQAKVAEIFGATAASITTYAQYMDLVTYIKAVKDDVDFAPTSLTADEKLYIVDSLKLGAEKLFEAEPKVKVTSVTPDTTAGNWKFEVTVTEDKGTGAIEVAVAEAKIQALVKVSTDLKTWGPAETTAVMEGNKVSVTVVNFGDGTTGFMKISE